jgi:CheY-like chemotaxis protein
LSPGAALQSCRPVSAGCESEDVAAALKAGAQEHLAKPVTMSALCTALSTACDLEQQQSLGP